MDNSFIKDIVVTVSQNVLINYKPLLQCIKKINGSIQLSNNSTAMFISDVVESHYKNNITNKAIKMNMLSVLFKEYANNCFQTLEVVVLKTSKAALKKISQPHYK